MSAGAHIEGYLGARIYETRSGATIWANGFRRKETVAQLGLSRAGLSGLGATHRPGGGRHGSCSGSPS